MKVKWILAAGLLLAAMLLLTACAGQQGPPGPPGPAGPPGPEGPQGPAAPTAAAAEPGSGVTPAEYIGSATCGGCHSGVYETFIRSGHPWKLNKIENGQPPDYPFRNLGQLPEGYTWNDISYVIGGYWWKARYMDQEGHIITDAPGSTGNAEYLNQWNYANDELGFSAGWVPYKSGTENLPYDCGECHTTGYSRSGNQDGLPGIVGTWAEPGIQCERCHGPGSLHAANPSAVRPIINRNAELCGECHRRGEVEQVDAKDGFVDHHEQYEELYQGKHLVLDCVDCHDPHALVKQFEQAGLPATRTACENCHFEQAKYQKVEQHVAIDLDCIECHMPRMIKSAWGDPERFTGDIRTHLMAIDPEQFDQVYTVTQEDGSEKQFSNSQIGLNFACRHCHMPDTVMARDDQTLMNAAFDYHAKPAEPPTAPPPEATSTAIEP